MSSERWLERFLLSDLHCG